MDRLIRERPDHSPCPQPRMYRTANTIAAFRPQDDRTDHQIGSKNDHLAECPGSAHAGAGSRALTAAVMSSRYWDSKWALYAAKKAFPMLELPSFR